MLSTNPVTANLIKAREMIADKKNWCQWRFSVGKRQVCAEEALRRAEGEEDGPDHPALDYLTQASHVIAGRAEFGPIYVNDTMGHAATLRMFDKAIELSLQD